MAGDEWAGLVEDGVAFRQELHRHPELPWEEHETAGRIRARLDALGIPWRACAGTGTVARLAPDAKGPHIALRADIDALPIEERTELPWASEAPGCMHACGHDGHTATLWVATRWLKVHEASLPGPVTLLFQPAEEGGHGAKKMIEAGALEGVDRIYGWHNWPTLAEGEVLCPDGLVMAGNGHFEIEVQGVGGHASQPQSCRDPVLAASAIVLALQQVVSRRFAPQDAVVLAVTSFVAPSAVTVIPGKATLAGSFRIADPAHRAPMTEAIETIARQTAEAYGTACEVHVHRRYDPTVNHPEPARIFREALAKEFGDAVLGTASARALMASEDFSYYLQAIPGAFALVGAGRDAPPCHNARYDFNDALIPRVARAFILLAGAPPPPTT